MFNPKRFSDQAMEAAVEAAQKVAPPAAPAEDPRLIQLRQLFTMSWRAVRAASQATYQAETAYQEALRTHKEIAARLELLEIETGVLTEDTDHDLDAQREETDENGRLKVGK
jgi:hypothetical protein